MASYQAFSGQFKHLTGQNKFGSKNYYQCTNHLVSNRKASIRTILMLKFLRSKRICRNLYLESLLLLIYRSLKSC